MREKKTREKGMFFRGTVGAECADREKGIKITEIGKVVQIAMIRVYSHAIIYVERGL